MSREYAVTFKTSRQVSPDDWELYWPVFKATSETTIREIEEWFLSHCQPKYEFKDDRRVDTGKDHIVINGLYINQLETKNHE